jgi:hypothetical protein
MRLDSKELAKVVLPQGFAERYINLSNLTLSIDLTLMSIRTV